jgi:hypothetical protein
MFGTDPWQTDFGSTRRWRLPSVPVLVVGAIVLLWLFRYGSVLWPLAEYFLTPDGDTTLDLPDGLVLARLPWSYSWNPDPDGDGLLLVPPPTGDQAGGAWGIQHWTRPWKEGQRQPMPPEWRLAVPPGWGDQPDMLASMGLNSPVTGDHRFLAVVDHAPATSPTTRIVALPGGRDVARVQAIPAGVNGKCIAWHPRENVLVVGTYGSVTLAAGPDWQARTLATAPRDYAQWSERVSRGEEETGFYPSENVSQLVFSEDGALLLAAMNRGLRVFDWAEVRRATARLPAPRWAVDGQLVKHPILSMRMTFSVAHDARRGLVLWSEYDGKLNFLDLATGEHGTVLALPNRYCMTRLHLCPAGDALVAEIVRMGKSNNGPCVLAVLDYPRLLRGAGIER